MTTRKIVFMSLDEIREAKSNPKNHVDDKIAASLAEFDYAEPMLLDDRTERLVAGHGRLNGLKHRRALVAGGEINPKTNKPYTVPDGVRVVKGVWQAAVVRGWSSADDDQAEAYLVASNELTIQGGWDDKALSSLLAGLRARDEERFEATGYDSASLDRLLASLAVPTPDPQGAETQPRLDQFRAVKCPECGHEFHPR